MAESLVKQRGIGDNTPKFVGDLTKKPEFSLSFLHQAKGFVRLEEFDYGFNNPL